jgi:hypothetical protein
MDFITDKLKMGRASEKERREFPRDFTKAICFISFAAKFQKGRSEKTCGVFDICRNIFIVAKYMQSNG